MILTQKENEARKAKTIKKAAPVESKAGAVERVEAKPDVEYVLFNPEHRGGYKDVITLDGKRYERDCQNGVIITRNKALADFLKRKEYTLIDTREVKNE